MLKIICFMNRRPGMTLDEFRDYYENVHVPLINRLVPYSSDYRRNYAVPERPHRTAIGDPARTDELFFDVMTELWYESEEMYQRLVEALADPEIGRIIAEDEARFFDRASMRSYIVDERSSTPSGEHMRKGPA